MVVKLGDHNDIILLNEFCSLIVTSRTVSNVRDILGDDVQVGDTVQFPISKLTHCSQVRVSTVCPKCGSVKEQTYEVLLRKGHSFCNECRPLASDSYIGGTYGHLTILGYGERKKWKNKFVPTFRCNCICGNVVDIVTYDVMSGATSSCGCYSLSIRSGENSYLYDHTITPDERASDRMQRKSIDAKQWSKLVLERDNYTCGVCGHRGVRLHAHHIEGFKHNKELRTSVDNGITLCTKCHRGYHNWNGGAKVPATRVSFERYISELTT